MDDEYDDARELAADLLDRPGMRPRRRRRATLDGEDPRRLADDIVSASSPYRNDTPEEESQ